MKKLNLLVVLVATLFAAQLAFAGPKTLFKMKDGKQTAGLAKSWTKVEDGKYEFVLDKSHTLKKGKPLTTEAVKNSLEAKMKRKFSVKVVAKGDSAVVVTYKGDETKFLEKVAKTRIRAKRNIELAVESSVSEGGIRANAANRPPNAGEVKVRVSKIKGDVITARVITSKMSQIVDGSKVKVIYTNKALKLKPGATLFFVPEELKGKVWKPMDKTLTTK